MRANEHGCLKFREQSFIQKAEVGTYCFEKNRGRKQVNQMEIIRLPRIVILKTGDYSTGKTIE